MYECKMIYLQYSNKYMDLYCPFELNSGYTINLMGMQLEHCDFKNILLHVI